MWIYFAFRLNGGYSVTSTCHSYYSTRRFYVIKIPNIAMKLRYRYNIYTRTPVPTSALNVTACWLLGPAAEGCWRVALTELGLWVLDEWMPPLRYTSSTSWFVAAWMRPRISSRGLVTTFVVSTKTTWSPGRRPERSAGLPGSTRSTRGGLPHDNENPHGICQRETIKNN